MRTMTTTKYDDEGDEKLFFFAILNLLRGNVVHH